MIKNKLKRTVLVVGMTLTVVVSTIPTYAREIGTFQNFTVKYSGGKKFTSFLSKSSNGGNGVVNLSNDTGTAWITAQMKNSEGAYRGGCTLQRGTRKVFSNTGKAGYVYRLGMRKTNNTGGGTVTIKGSWSPDEA